MFYKLLTLTLTSLCLFVFAAPANSQSNWEKTATPYAAHRDYDDFIHTLTDNERFELERFINYQFHREPCENYVEPPAGLKVKNCKLYFPHKSEMKPVPSEVPAVVEEVAEAPEPQVVETPKELAPVIKSYTVYFPYNSHGLTTAAEKVLDQAAADLKKYSPEDVTVAGYTDTVGSNAYNETLSMKRAESVVEALNKRGIESRTLDKKAYGETELAEETADGVESQKNRRVVIDFRK